MFEIHVGELRATFLRNHNMRRHKRLQRHHTGPQAEDNSSLEKNPTTPATPTTATSTRALHPIRGTAPDQGRCTRYGALHPLCGGAPEQKRCIAYGSGAAPLGTSESVVGVCRGDCVAQWGGLPRHRCVWTGVQEVNSWRCTRYGALHPLRGGAPEQKRCIAYGSGAVPQHTRTNAELAHRTTPRHTPPCAAGRNPGRRNGGNDGHTPPCAAGPYW